MTESEKRNQAKEKMAGSMVEAILEKMDYSEEQEKAFKAGVYCGLKSSFEIDVFQIGMKALEENAEQKDGDLFD